MHVRVYVCEVVCGCAVVWLCGCVVVWLCVVCGVRGVVSVCLCYHMSGCVCVLLLV